jgi:AAA15 family ATPase/GTPase
MNGTMIGLLDHRDPSRLTRIFSNLKRYEILDQFSHEMNLVFPEVINIDSVPFPDGSHTPLYIRTHDEHKLPIHTFGDGVCRWFLILGEIIILGRSAICIEEIETSFHPASHRPLSQKLYEYALKYRAQLFLSSHSHEFVDTFLEALYGDEGVVDPKKKDPVQVFTLKRSGGGQPELWELAGKEAFEKRKKFKLELLG